MPIPRPAIARRYLNGSRIPSLPGLTSIGLTKQVLDPAPPANAKQPLDKAQPITQSSDQSALSRYGKTYFKLMATDYRSILNPQPPAVRSQLDALVDKTGAPTSWDDIYLLERGVIVVLPETLLRARLPFLRSEFEAAATPDEYQDYLRTTPPDAQNGPLEKIRADALALIDQIQWRAITTPYFDSLRSRTLLNLILCTILYVEAATIAFVLLNVSNQYCFHLVVAIFFGILGGAVSTIQRIQSLPANSTTLTNLKSMQGWHVALLTSPLIGGISAALLFFLCAGEELPQTIFPVLKNYDSRQNAVLNVFFGGGAIDFSNVAKLIIWSFVAGFSERFIPDTVSRLTAKISS
jgi:hypothetical protein